MQQQRRHTLKLMALGAGSVALARALPVARAAESAAAMKPRRVILVELQGANDGLNTLVPWRDERYRELRPTLALKPASLITLDNDLAMHAALEPLMPAWEHGDMAWVHGLGYPAPNRSHFASIGLWESGGDGYQSARSGWMTEALQEGLAHRIEHAHGISLVSDMDLFESDGGRYLALGDSTAVQAVGMTATGEQLPLAALGSNTLQSQVQQQFEDTDRLVAAIAQRLGTVPPQSVAGGGPLAAQLGEVLRLIKAGIDTPFYRVRLGGFDTHERQLPRHQNLLARLAAPLAAFREKLIADGEWDNTLIMTYSEFGRRARENLSGGTDHGTAAPHLLLGGGVEGGFHGERPDLGALIDDDLAHTTDYRAVYDRILSDWLGIPDQRFSSWRNPGLQSLLKST